MAMKDNNELDRILDRALDEISSAETDPQAEQTAAARVWEKLAPLVPQVETEPERHIRDCDDFQALIPAYLQDGLNDAKAMLLEDHLNLMGRSPLVGPTQGGEARFPDMGDPYDKGYQALALSLSTEATEAGMSLYPASHSIIER